MKFSLRVNKGSSKLFLEKSLKLMLRNPTVVSWTKKNAKTIEKLS
jgi:ribosomal protein L24E